MKKIVIASIITLLCISLKGQFLENYGLKAGLGFANQYYDYDNFSSPTGWRDYKAGFQCQLFAEKKLIQYLSLYTSAGYVQKGYRDDITVTDEEKACTFNDRLLMNLHNLNMDICLKAIFVKEKLLPYLLCGLRNEFLLNCTSKLRRTDYKNSELIVPIHLKEYNIFNLSLLLSFGLSFKDVVFMEIEYNSNLTNTFRSKSLIVDDKYFGISLGCNLNKIWKKKKMVYYY